MNLGCIDMGCIDKHTSLHTPRSASKIKKPTNCKSSPINWFPRKKVDSFLKRKIQHLQEADGMSTSILDETLGDANPHYSRVLREKMAVREAAHKAMEARKSAMVEASWCRILKAARIESKIAEAQLLKAEECAAKAFEDATSIGVIMYDAPDCPTKRYKIETTSPKGGCTTHTIKASFETAFEVDKQVAAAVKSAFMKLETCPSMDKDDLKKLFRKISEHPDTHEHYQELSEFSSDSESDKGPDITRVGTRKDDNWDMKYEKDTPVRQKKQKKRHALEKFNKENLVDMMFERFKGLPEDGLSSLATIVATCGLSAALAEAEIGSKQDSGSVVENSSTHTVRLSSFRTATVDDGHIRKKIPGTELPSLDKCLVKRLTRLEREVLDAKNAQNNEQKRDKSVVNDCSISDNVCSDHISAELVNDLQKDPFKSEGIDLDLGSILVQNTSRPKDVRLHGINGSNQDKKLGAQAKDVIEASSLELVKHMTRLEKEVQEAKNQRLPNPDDLDHVPDKENTDKNTAQNDTNRDVDSCQRQRRNHLENSATFSEGLDTILVKHLSRLEKEKLRLQAEEEIMPTMKRQKDRRKELETGEGSLDQVLVKHKSRLEIEKAQQPETQVRHSSTRRVAREKELEEAWGGLSLGNLKHVSRLEKEKLSMQSEEEIMPKMKKQEDSRNELGTGEGGLDQVLVEHKFRLEIEKARQPETIVRHSSTRRVAREKELKEAWGGLSLGNSMRPHPSKLEKEKQPTEVRRSSARRDAREKELQQAWGGLSLGNSIRPHLSKLQREKAAWLKAEDEQRREATKV